MKKSLKKTLSLLMVFMLAITSVVPAFAEDVTATPAADLPVAEAPAAEVLATDAPAVANHVIISQVYGGGGSTDSTFKNDFVELYNPTSGSVDLNGWSVQYAAADTGKSYAVVPLNGSIQPGRYYLVQLKAGAAGAALPTYDATGNIDLSASKGKVALASKATAITVATDGPLIIDLVGFGTATEYEGKATVAMSTTAALIRKVVGVDSDNNFEDFQTATPYPRNSTAINGVMVETKCATPTASKASGLIDQGSVVTFSSSTTDAEN